MGRLPIDVGGSSRSWEVVDVCLSSYIENCGKSPTTKVDGSVEPINTLNSLMQLKMQNKSTKVNKNPENQHEPLDGRSKPTLTSVKLPSI